MYIAFINHNELVCCVLCVMAASQDEAFSHTYTLAHRCHTYECI